MAQQQVTAPDIRNAEEPITCLTCYDYLTARIMDQVSELDMILVGDSLANVMLGHDSTVSVTVDDMVHHTQAVAKAVQRVFLVADIPFLEMARSQDHLVSVVQRLVGEAGAQSVKIEGGERHAESVEHLVRNDVPVVGHLGLTPQSVQALGGYHVQARTKEEITKLGRDARALEDAGVLAIVLECIPDQVARQLTRNLSVPTIGIGAGSGCNGQVLVWQDMMGLSQGESASFVRTWGDLSREIEQGVKGFCEDVRTGSYPSQEESYALKQSVDQATLESWISP